MEIKEYLQCRQTGQLLPFRINGEETEIREVDSYGNPCWQVLDEPEAYVKVNVAIINDESQILHRDGDNIVVGNATTVIGDSRTKVIASSQHIFEGVNTNPLPQLPPNPLGGYTEMLIKNTEDVFTYPYTSKKSAREEKIERRAAERKAKRKKKKKL